MLKFNKGFSLIELMVVIAIVALLAAIALPAYKGYVTSTKLGIARDYIAKTANTINTYMATERAWPTSLDDFGITVNPNPDDISDFTSHVVFTDYHDNAIVSGVCNSYTLSSAISGLSQDTFSQANPGIAISMVTTVAETPNKFQSWCNYYYFDSAVDGLNPLAGDYIDGCTNTLDTTAMTALENEVVGVVFTECQ